MSTYVTFLNEVIIPNLLVVAGISFFFACYFVFSKSRFFPELARRFRTLTPFGKFTSITMLCLCTMWGGSKESGRIQDGDQGDDQEIGQEIGQGGPKRTPAHHGPASPGSVASADASVTNTFAILEFRPDHSARSLYFTLVIPSDAVTNALTRSVDFFASTNLAEESWTRLAGVTIPENTNRFSFVISGDDIPAPMRTNFLSAFSRSGFYTFGLDSDTDGDGLTDSFERFCSRTDPGKADTDGDGLDDSEEYFSEAGLNPLNPFDALLDPDNDSIPTLYEIRNGTDPMSPDWDAVPKIVIGEGSVTTLRAALKQSRPYSIIVLPPGIHGGGGWTGLFFPPHPVMVTTRPGAGSTLLRFSGTRMLAAFHLFEAGSAHSFFQGFTLDMSPARSGFNAGFWCGGNLPFSGDSVSAAFRNVYVRLPPTDEINVAFFCRHSSPVHMVFSGCVVNAYGAEDARGIYIIDGSPALIENCSFINFPCGTPSANYAVQLESSAANWGKAVYPVDVEISNCLFDTSFTNAEPVALLEDSVSYRVNLYHGLMPRPPTNSLTAVSMLYTNSMTQISGIPAADSPARGAGAPVRISHTDFNGNTIAEIPDIGAFQYAESGVLNIDSDCDGLSDTDEETLFHTDPMLYDTDGDGQGDGFEVAPEHGTDPLSRTSFFAGADVKVKYAFQGLTDMTNYVCYGYSPTGWDGLGLRYAVSTSSFDYSIKAQGKEVYIKHYLDMNRNGQYDDESELMSVKRVRDGEERTIVEFAVGDIDGDGQGDYYEREHGSDPFDPNSRTVRSNTTIKINDTPYSFVTNYISYGFSATGWETNGLCRYVGPVKYVLFNFVTTNQVAYVKLMRDFNGNGRYDEGIDELRIKSLPTSSEKEFAFTFEVGDADGDGIPDSTEDAEGTDKIDKRSFCYNITFGLFGAFKGTNCFSVALTEKGEGDASRIIPPVVLVTNSEITINYPHLPFTNSAGLSMVIFDDINQNSICETNEIIVLKSFTPTNHSAVLELEMPRGRFDADGDGILDRCEVAFGLDPANNDDAFEDPDGDGLINLHEYWMGCNPLVPDGSNTLLSVISRSITERLRGKDPAESLRIYSNYDTAESAYALEVNTNCWAYGLDFSCCSMWNNRQYGNYRQYAATAISPRHIVMATHFGTRLNTVFFFRGRDGMVYSSTMLRKMSIGGSDIEIGYLDPPLPEAVVSAKILPAEFRSYIGTGRGLPVLTLDQEEKALVMELGALPLCNPLFKPGIVECQDFHATIPSGYYESMIDGDSSNPRFLVVGDDLVLLHTMWKNGRGSGSLLTLYKEQIQGIMDELSPEEHYTLEEFDFSGFEQIALPWGDL